MWRLRRKRYWDVKQITIGSKAQPIAERPKSCKSVVIKSRDTNSGYIYIGKSNVSSTNCYRLSAGESISIDVDPINMITFRGSENDYIELNDIYIHGSSSNDVVDIFILY